MSQKTQSDNQTAAKRIAEFRKALKSEHVRKITLAEKKDIFKRLGIRFPKRVTSDHHFQETFVFECNTYKVVVNSGIIDNKLLTPGLSWVMITRDDKRLLVRTFKSDDDEPSQAMLDRLLAYALVFKKMIIGRPMDPRTDELKGLIEKSEEFTNRKGKKKVRLRAYWTCESATDEVVFSENDLKKYLSGIPEHLQKAFLEKERKTESYWEHRKAKKLRKEIRKKSKVTKEKNRAFGDDFSQAVKNLAKRGPLERYPGCY